MSGARVDHRRRRFFSDFLREHIVKPVAQVRSELEQAAARERAEQVYESELRAFGPEVLADTARRQGIDADGADYEQVARALAEKGNEDRHER